MASGVPSPRPADNPFEVGGKAQSLKLSLESVRMVAEGDERERAPRLQLVQGVRYPGPGAIERKVLGAFEARLPLGESSLGSRGGEAGSHQDLRLRDEVALRFPIGLPRKWPAAENLDEILMDAMITVGYVEHRAVEIKEEPSLAHGSWNPLPSSRAASQGLSMAYQSRPGRIFE